MVRLWVADVATVPAHAARNALKPSELEREARFHRAADAHRFAAARLLLRTALGATLGVGAEDVHFQSDPRGKPRLAAPCHEPPLHFSVSHAGEVLMVAIARRRVGVDVERVRWIPDLDAIARVCFAADEQALLGASSRVERHERFFTMWTRKEAWAKATGLGLGATLPSTTPDLPTGWSGAPLVCPAGYRSAVVIEGELTGVEHGPSLPDSSPNGRAF